MSDFGLLDEEYERYVIGFTENHFIPSDTNSPTPSDHAIGYNTFASDFAERSNRGTLKNFLDHSFDLDRKRRRSVIKIHNNILDLMSELSERRKVGTPLLSKSAMELHRSDSRSSSLSGASIKTSSSLPLIEVQQLPPLTQSTRSLPSLQHDYFGLPDIGIDTKEIGKPKTKKHRKKQTNEKYTKDKIAVKRQDSNGQTKFGNLVQSVMNRNEEQPEASYKTHNKNNDTNIENKTNDSKNVRFIVGDPGIQNEEDQSENDKGGTSEARNKWKTIYAKLKEAMAVVKERGDSFNSYKGRYYTNAGDGSVRKMSFCQSSYQERTERERMNNIRRRHSAQTKVAPIDINKLRRQVTMGKSKTTFC